MTDADKIAVIQQGFFAISLIGGTLIMLNVAILVALLGGRRG